jgi:putative drug exporter of the RND superfamily
VRFGIIRTVDSTGATSTSGRFIFAALMFRLPFASIATTVQAGFVIGIRVLLDTFLLRTITVPAVAVLVGQANWWPSRLRPPAFERAQRVLATHRPMNDVHRRRVQTRVTVPPTVTAPTSLTNFSCTVLSRCSLGMVSQNNPPRRSRKPCWTVT